jgi:cytochrome P450
VAALLDRLPEEDRTKLQPLYDHFSTGLIHTDPPDHARLRRLLNVSFTPRLMQDLRPRAQEIVDELIKPAETSRKIEVVSELAFPLPLIMISEIVGVPVGNRFQFKKWCDDVNPILGSMPTLESALVMQESVIALRTFLSNLIAERRAQPEDDLISRMIAAQEAESWLSEAELIQTSVTLMIAAHETTTSLMANGLLTLLRHPDQLGILRQMPELIQPAVDELLRYEPPLNHFTRIAKDDLTIADKLIQKGQVVTFSLLAANRDPEKFPDPDRLDITRQNNNHLAFGFGAHYCLGAPLAVVEGQVAIGTMVKRFPQLTMSDQQIEWRQERVAHGVKELRLEL